MRGFSPKQRLPSLSEVRYQQIPNLLVDQTRAELLPLQLTTVRNR
jgi:hypothetical protein